MGGSSSKKANEIKEESKHNSGNGMLKVKEEKKEDVTNDNDNDIEEFRLDDDILINVRELPNIKKESAIEKNYDGINPEINYDGIIKENNQNKIKEIKEIKENKENKEKIKTYTKKESQKIITNFYDDFIEILYCYNSRKMFVTLVKSFNEKYLYNFNCEKFPDTKESKAFLESFKYSSIIIACFIFLVKDNHLYDNSIKKTKDNFEQFIFTCLESMDKTVIFSLKIIAFIQKYKKIRKSLFGCTSGIMKTLFKNKSSYKSILNCLEQILNKINNEPTHNVITKINESILFCYNASNIINNSNANGNEKEKENKNNNNANAPEKQIIANKISKNKSVKNIKYTSKNLNNVSKRMSYFNIKIEKKTNITNNINGNGNSDERKEVQDMDVPFIKKELDKKFCLVLDIDETLSHMVKLPFGNYFLVRPGVMDLLKELYTYYEIDIFTAALKHYADNIVNKLDKDNKYISYRLYRCHCTYEDGKSVKKLSLIGRDLNKIVFVDDLERNAKYNMKNLVLVSKWIDDVYDNEIINLKNKLKSLALSSKYDEDITQGLIDEKLTGNIK